MVQSVDRFARGLGYGITDVLLPYDGHGIYATDLCHVKRRILALALATT